MGRGDDKSRRTGGEMRFLDELEAEADLLTRLGRSGEGRIYDEGYGTDDEPGDDGLLEFTDDGIPAGDDDEEPSQPVRIFVGRTAIPAGSHGPIDDGSESEFEYDDDDSMAGVLDSTSLPIAAADYEEEEDDDDFDEFEDDSPAPLRAPANSPGMRLLTPEREDSLDTDRAWPGLQTVQKQPAPKPERPSWLDALPDVRPRSDAGHGQSADKAWDAPLLDFGSDAEPARRPVWSLEDDDEELEAGDEEGGELPVHEPLSYGDDSYAEADYQDAFGDDPEDEDEADTGTWNRLAVLASKEVAEREQSRFGVAPAPVWRAEDPGERADFARSEGGAVDPGSQPWGTEAGWDGPTEESGRPPSIDSDEGPALPPIQPMASVLQAELNQRPTLEPKAVVLKTLDGVQQAPPGALDEPSELRSRVPGAGGRGGRVEAQTGPVPVEPEGGTGRLLLIVAVTLLITVGAVWQWRSTLFPEEAVVTLDPPAKIEAVEESPDMLVHNKGTDPQTTPPPPAVPEDPPPAGTDLPPEPVVADAAPAPEHTEPTEAELEAARKAEEEKRNKRRDDLDMGRLSIRTDIPASVYINGKRVGKTPFAAPLTLRPGHYDIKVVPHGRGRTYRTDTRVDAGRLRNIEVEFSK